MARNPFFPDEDDEPDRTTDVDDGDGAVRAGDDLAGASRTQAALVSEATVSAAPDPREPALRAWRAGRFDEAEELLDALATSALGDRDSQQAAAGALFDLGRLYADQERYDLAVATHARAVALRDKLAGPDVASLAEGLFHMGWALWRAGRAREAEQALRRAMRIAEAKPETRSALLGDICTNLALVLADVAGGESVDDEEEDEQESLLRRALEHREAVFGPDATETAASLNNLANVYARRREFDRAIELHRRGLEIREARLPAGHPDLAESLGNLGRALMDAGRPAEAELLLARAVQIERRTATASADRLVNLLERLADLRRGRRDYPAALRLLEEALAEQERRLGPDDLEVAGTLNNLAGVYAGLGRFEQAERAGRRCLDIRRRALGPEAPSVVQTLRNLAFIASLQGKLDDAEALCREALDLVGRRAGPEHPDVAAVLEQLARILDRRGDDSAREQARDLRARAATVQAQAAESDLFAPDFEG